MAELLRDCEELIRLDGRIWLLTATAGVPAYDFAFAKFFPFDRAWDLPNDAEVIARVGAFEDYEARYQQLASAGLRLVNSPTEHLRASQLPYWYPLISELTPKSRWYDHAPTPAEVEEEFGWPVFLKGERQTDHHRRALSIARNADEYQGALSLYAEIPLLNWQRLTVRKFEILRPVEDVDPEKIPSSFEFRTFWWKGELVGIGSYWHQGKPYTFKGSERDACIEIASDAAKRVNVPFLVVDVAQTLDGRWIVIECNDAQESGYAGVHPLGMWQRVLDASTVQPEAQ